MYYIEFENKIVLADDNLERLRITLQCRPEYEGSEIKETERPLVQGDGEYIYADTPEYEEEQKQKERERIANLSLTRGDVFRGLLLAKQVTRADIRSLIELMPEDTPQQRMEKEYALIDFDESLNFYRGVALIDTLGAQLNITPTQMDRFFDTNDWHELVNEENNI